MKKNLSLILFLLIAVAALGGGYYVYQHNYRNAPSAPMQPASGSPDAASSAALFKAGFNDLAAYSSAAGAMARQSAGGELLGDLVPAVP